MESKLTQKNGTAYQNTKMIANLLQNDEKINEKYFNINCIFFLIYFKVYAIMFLKIFKKGAGNEHGKTSEKTQ